MADSFVTEVGSEQNMNVTCCLKYARLNQIIYAAYYNVKQMMADSLVTEVGSEQNMNITCCLKYARLNYLISTSYYNIKRVMTDSQHLK